MRYIGGLSPDAACGLYKMQLNIRKVHNNKHGATTRDPVHSPILCTKPHNNKLVLTAINRQRVFTGQNARERVVIV